MAWDELSDDVKVDMLAFEARGVGAPSDLVCAMSLLQEMRESQDFCCISLESDYDYVWDITYVRSELKGNTRHKRQKASDYSHYTLVEAIHDFYDAWKDNTLP